MAGKYDKEIKIKVTDGGQLKRTTKDVDKLNKAVNNTTKSSSNFDRNMKGNARMSSNASKNFSKQAQGMQGVLVPAYAEVAARVFALSAAFNALSKAADYRMMLAGQTRFAQMTGKNMGLVAKSVQKASKYMLDFKEASTSAALASTAGLATKQIVQMTKSALDSSVALGRSMTDTMDRLTRGIVKAEPEILDEIGVIIRLDTVYKDFAKTVNKTTSELSESEKLMARYTAIIGQLGDKFGGIADSAKANVFQQLSATVMDLVNKFSTKVLPMFDPLLDFLASSKIIISALIALILKGLIGKMFPALGMVGKKIAAMPTKMAEGVDRLGKATKRTAKHLSTLQKAQQKIIKAPSMFKDLIEKGTKGKRSANLIDIMSSDITSKKSKTRLANSMRATIAYARAQIARDLKKGGKGIVTGGLLAGMDREQVGDFAKSWEPLRKSMVGTSKAMLLVNRAALGASSAITTLSLKIQTLQIAIVKTAVTFGNFILKLNTSYNSLGFFQGFKKNFRDINRSWRVAEKGAKGFGKVLLGVGKTFTHFSNVAVGAIHAIGAAFSALMKVFMVYSMVSMLGSMLTGIKDVYGKATEAANNLSDTLKETLQTAVNKDYNISFDNLASSFAQSLKNSEFKANLSEQISQALSETISSLKGDFASDIPGAISDWVKDKVNYGYDDALQDAADLAFQNRDSRGLTAPMEAMQSDINQFILKHPYFGEDTADRTKELMTALRDSKSVEDFKALTKYLSDEGKTDLMTKLLETFTRVEAKEAVDFRKSANSVKELSDEWIKYSKARAEFSNKLVADTSYKEMAASQKKIINLFKSDTDTIAKIARINYLNKIGLLDDADAVDAKYFKKEAARILEKETLLAKNKGIMGTDLVAAEEKSIQQQKANLKKVGDRIYDAMFEGKNITSVIVKQFGQNAIKINNELILQATKLNDLEAKNVQLKKLGNSSLEAQALIRQSIMREELKNMTDSLITGVTDGTLKGAELQATTAAIGLFAEKIADAGVSAVKLGKHLAKVNGTTYTMSQHIKDMRKDFRGSKTDIDNWELETVTASFNKIKNDTLHIAENTRDTFKEQDKIAAVLSQLQEARNKGVDMQNKSLKDWAKLAKLAYTKEGQLLVSKKANLEDELFILNNSDDHFGKQQVLLDTERSLLLLKRKVTDEALGATRSEVAALMLGVAIKETQDELTKAKLDEEVSWLANSMAETASTFGLALTSVLTDLLLDRDPQTDWETQLREGLARSAATMLSTVVTDGIFGGKGKSFFNFGSKEGEDDRAGLLHQILKGWFGVEDAILNVILPQTQVSILQGILAELKKQTPQIFNSSTSLNEATTARIKFDEKWLEKDDQGLPSGQSERYSQLLTSLGDFKGSAVVDKTTLVNALRAAWEVQESKLLKEGETISAEKELIASEKIIKAVQAMKPSKFMSDEANKWFIGMDDKLLKFVNAYRDTMGQGAISDVLGDALNDNQSALETLISEMAKVRWDIFAKATENLTAAFVPEHRSPATGFKDGKPVGMENQRPGFRMYIPGFTEAVGESMKKGMDSLTKALGSEGKIKIQDFDGASLKKASDLIGTTFKGIELETASKDIHTAFSGSSFKVTEQNKLLTVAANHIIASFSGNALNVNVMNTDAFNLTPSTSVTAQDAVEYTELLKHNKLLNEISTALKSHSEGSTISKASIEELSKAVSASVASIFERNLIDPAATIGAVNSSNLSMTRADIAEPTDNPGMLDWAGHIAKGMKPSVTRILTAVNTHVVNAFKLLDAMAIKTLDELDTLISFEVGAPLQFAAEDISHFVDVLDNKIVPVLTKLDPALDKLPELMKEMTTTLKAVNDWIGPDDDTPDSSYLNTIGDFFSTKPDISEDTAYRLSGPGRYEDLSDKKKAALENISSRNWKLQTDADLGAEGWTAIPGLKNSFMDGFKTMEGAQLTFAHALLNSIEMLPENSAFLDDPDFFLGKDRGQEIKFLKEAKNSKNNLNGFNEGATGTVYISALAEMIKTLIHEKNHSDTTGQHFGEENHSSYSDNTQWDKWFTENKNMYKGLAEKVPTIRTNSSGELEETKNIHQKRNINTARLYPMNQIVEEILVRTKTALASMPSGTKAEDVVSKDVWGILTDKFKEVLRSLETKINLVEGGLEQRFAVLMNVSEKGPGMGWNKNKTLYHDPKSSDRGTFFKPGEKIPKDWEKGINKSEGYLKNQAESQLKAQQKIAADEASWRKWYQEKEQKALDKEIKRKESLAKKDAEYEKNRAIAKANEAADEKARKAQLRVKMGKGVGGVALAYIALQYVINKLTKYYEDIFATQAMKDAYREGDIEHIRLYNRMPNEGFGRQEGEYEALQKEFDSGAFSDDLSIIKQDIMATKGELESLSAPEIYWNMGLEIGRSILEFFDLNNPSTSNTIDDMKADPTHQYINMLEASLNNQYLTLADIAENTRKTETDILATQALASAGSTDGVLDINMTNVNEIRPTVVTLDQKGQPIITENPTGDYTTENMSLDIRTSLKNNLHSQIMNDNLNVKSLIVSSLSTVSSNFMSSALNSFFGLTTNANGGVLSGGFKAFASGGTVSKPTLGLVGEGKYNEAIVPLPDGKSIPVIGATGSTENNITVNVTIDSDGNAKSNTSSGMDGDTAKQLGYMVSQAVQAELVDQKRPGGLLSRY